MGSNAQKVSMPLSFYIFDSPEKLLSVCSEKFPSTIPSLTNKPAAQ
jgi:hypothetical protein